VLMLAGIDDQKLDSTASHPSSIFLVSQSASPCHLSFRAPCDDEYGWSGSTVSVAKFRLGLLLSLYVGRQTVSVSAKVTAVSEPSVSAVVSVTAITGLQLRRHFRLWPKPEKKLVSVGLYSLTASCVAQKVPL